MTKDEVMAAIKQMNVLELADMVKALEQEFGISAAPMAVAVAPGGGGVRVEAPAAEEEKTEFAVAIKEIGPNKINVIKAVREVTSLGLREAKELVESAPVQVKEGIVRDEAETIKGKLEAAGAVVELR